MIGLRPYQQESILQLRQGFGALHQRQVLCLPTGAGKTVVFSEMVRMASAKATRTLVLTDRTELFLQTIKALGKVGVAVEQISPDRKHVYTGATIYLAMVETIKRRMHLEINPDLIIIDEAHKASFNRIITHYPNAKVIGATATPEGKHFFQYYTNIVQNIDIPELIEQGYLVDCKAYQMQDDFSDLETKAGEYTDASLMGHFDKPKLYGGVIDRWRELADGKKTICFNVNIEHTIKTHQAFLDAGITSEYITSKTTKQERERILSAFHNGAFTVLNNCGILTTGYDEDTIQCVIMNRATKSLPLAMQIPGRASRAWKGCVNGLETAEERLDAIAKSPKPYFIYLDFGMNHDRHGLWNEEREWKLKPPKKKQEGVAPVKSCGNTLCGCIVATSARVCKFCGYIFPIKESQLAEGTMVEVTPRAPLELVGKRVSELTLTELVRLEQSKKYKPSFIWRVVRSHGEDAVKSYATIKGHSSGWVYRQCLDINNCEYTDYKIRNN